jgi:ketosteroid isomerase-like protein
MNDGGPAVRASQPTIDLLTEYYDAMEANDPERYGAYYADDMTLTFANTPTVTGRESALATLSDVLKKVRSLHHDLINIWEEDGGVVVFESVGTWNLHDGTAISISACTVCNLAGGKFTDQRIYVDNAPVFAALA